MIETIAKKIVNGQQERNKITTEVPYLLNYRPMCEKCNADEYGYKKDTT